MSEINNWDEWEPSKTDIEWTGNLISMLKSRGRWTVPYNGSIYEIDKENKRLLWIEGEDEKLTERNRVIFRIFGYTVVDARPHVTN